MAQKPSPLTLLKEPLIQIYGLMGLASLGLILLVQMSRIITPPGMFFNLMILLIGAAGVLLGWRSTVVIVLVVFGFGEVFQQFYFDGTFRMAGRFRFDIFLIYFLGEGREHRIFPTTMFEPFHVLLCFGFLGFAVAHYRLLSLVQHVFPLDHRLREVTSKSSANQRPKTRTIHIKRSLRTVVSVEVTTALLLLPLCTLAAEMAWHVLAWRWYIIGLPPPMSRFVLCCWLLFVGMALLSALFNYWRYVTMNAVQAQLVLQDEVWQQTRGEQRRTNRWLAWGQIQEQQKSSR